MRVNVSACAKHIVVTTTIILRVMEEGRTTIEQHITIEEHYRMKIR